MGFIRERKDVRGLIASFANVVSPLEFLGRLPRLSWLVRKTWLGRKLLYAQPGDNSGIGILMMVSNLCTAVAGAEYSLRRETSGMTTIFTTLDRIKWRMEI